MKTFKWCLSVLTINSKGTRSPEICHKPAHGREAVKTLEKILDVSVPIVIRTVHVMVFSMTFYGMKITFGEAR